MNTSKDSGQKSYYKKAMASACPFGPETLDPQPCSCWFCSSVEVLKTELEGSRVAISKDWFDELTFID